jgi:GAG-pre-integrase domain/Pol polyprotein, beta-barrel domain
MLPYKELFINYCSIDPQPITAANKQIFYAIGTGDLMIQVPNTGKFTPVILWDALHAPKMGLTVISINCITKVGHKVLFDGTMCRIKNSKGAIIGEIPVGGNGLYKVKHASMAAGAMTKTIKLSELHKRLGHISIATIHSLIKNNFIGGIKLTDDLNEFACDSCEYGKAMRKTIRKEWVAPLASSFGDEIHTDVWGPSPINSLGGHSYYVTFTDDATWYSKTQVICIKDEAFGAYRDFAAWVKTQHGVQIKRLCSDQGGEYMSSVFTEFLCNQGTECHLTTYDTPQHNGATESLNQRILEWTHTMLHQSQMPKAFGVLSHMTPLNNLRKRNWTWHMSQFGASKFGSTTTLGQNWMHANEGFWVGYDNDSPHAHRIYWKGHNKISVEQNIKFIALMIKIPFNTPSTGTQPHLMDAKPLLSTPSATPPSHGNLTKSDDETHLKDGPTTPVQTPQPLETPSTLNPAWTIQPEQWSTHAHKPSQYVQCLEQGEGTVHGYMHSKLDDKIPGVRGSSATFGNTKDMNSFVNDAMYYIEFNNVALQDLDGDPGLLSEAKSRTDWPQWEKAINTELKTVEDARTCEEVLRPQGKNVVNCKLIFKIKHKADSSILKYKVHLIACSFTQIYGIDYYKTYSPMAWGMNGEFPHDHCNCHWKGLGDWLIRF